MDNKTWMGSKPVTAVRPGERTARLAGSPRPLSVGSRGEGGKRGDSANEHAVRNEKLAERVLGAHGCDGRLPAEPGLTLQASWGALVPARCYFDSPSTQTG